MHAEKTDPPQSVIPYVGDESHFSRLAAVIPCMLYDYVLKPDGRAVGWAELAKPIIRE